MAPNLAGLHGAGRRAWRQSGQAGRPARRAAFALAISPFSGKNDTIAFKVGASSELLPDGERASIP